MGWLPRVGADFTGFLLRSLNTAAKEERWVRFSALGSSTVGRGLAQVMGAIAVIVERWVRFIALGLGTVGRGLAQVMGVIAVIKERWVRFVALRGSAVDRGIGQAPSKNRGESHQGTQDHSGCQNGHD